MILEAPSLLPQFHGEGGFDMIDDIKKRLYLYEALELRAEYDASYRQHRLN
jgi:hypothetical protein